MSGIRQTPKRTFSRRDFLRFGAAAAALLLEGCMTRVSVGNLVSVPTGSPLPANASRAAAAARAQQAYLYAGNALPGDTTPLYVEQVPSGGNRYSYLWPLTQAIAAALDLQVLEPEDPDNAALTQALVTGGLTRYWDGAAYRSYIVPPLGNGGDRYFDDNAWVGLNLERSYRVTGNQNALDAAERVFRYLITGWDTDPSHASPGGIFWVDAAWSRDRNTASNAPVAELGLRLYQATGEAVYLAWARRVYDWLNQALLAGNGLYWDRISVSGEVDNGESSCNQGTMCGVNVLLYQITNDATYLDRARSIAQAALALYARLGLSAQTPFNAIFLRNLLYLSTVDRSYLATTFESLQPYADQAWRQNRTGQDLFPFPAAARTVHLVDQSALIQIFACLACEPTHYNLLV